MKNKDKNRDIYEVIPESVFDKIERLADIKGSRERNGRFNNYLKIVARIHYKCIVHNELFFHPYPLASNYWIKVISGKYSTYLKELLEAEIIDVTKKKGRNYYNLNTNLCLFSPHKSINYKGAIKTGKINIQTDPEWDIEDRLGKRIVKCLDAISFDNASYKQVLSNDHLKFVADDYLIDINSFPKSLKLNADVYYPNGVDSNRYKVDTLLEIVAQSGQSIFYNKNKIIVDSTINFLQKRKANFVCHAELLIEKIKCKSFDLSRDEEKTRRVFHVLVSLPNKLLPFVKIDNNPVVGIDAKTSQFQLLANLFKHFEESGDQIANQFKGKRKTFIKNLYGCYQKISDTNSPNISGSNAISDFYEDVIKKDFYTQLQELLGLKTRNQAKIFCFTILFSRATTKNEFKSRIQDRYPLIISTLELFKEEYGYNQLAINLQALEAEIFIDHIFYRLFVKEKIKCFTRHDSIIVKESNAHIALKVVEDVYKKLGFNVVVKTENYSLMYEDYLSEALDDEDDAPSEELISLLSKYEDEGIESFDYSDFELTIDLGKEFISNENYNMILDFLAELPDNRLPIDNNTFNIINNILKELYNKYNLLI